MGCSSAQGGKFHSGAACGADAQGRRFGSAGLLDGLHRCPGRKISFTSCKRSCCPGGGGAGAGKLQPFPG